MLRTSANVLVVLAGVLMLATVSAQAITLDLVPVGDAGNAADTAAHSGGSPAGQGAVGYNYNIGKYEVTAGQYTAFLNAVGGVDTYALYNTNMSDTSYASGITRSGGGTVSDPYNYTVAIDFANRPVNYVSYWDTCRFANWLQNGQPTGAQGAGTTETGAYTLTTVGINQNTIVRNTDWKFAVTSEDEWYKAAYYQGGGSNAGYWSYPTKSNMAPGQDMADASGNNANVAVLHGTYPIDSGKYTTLVGEFQNSASPYGTFDQGGNVWEWNETVWFTYSRELRGGCWREADGVGALASASINTSGTVLESAYVGFRVVSVPEPNIITLLLAGAISLLAVAWRRRIKLVLAFHQPREDKTMFAKTRRIPLKVAPSMAKRWGVLCCVGLAVFGLGLPWAHAQVAPIVDWTHSWLLQGSGPANPLVSVNLNPQPEPPMTPRLLLTNPLRPVLSATSENENPNFRILFGVGGDRPLVIDGGGVPVNGHYEFRVRNATGGIEFLVSFDMGTSSGGIPDPGSWVELNPQPEPPMSREYTDGIGFDFQFTSMSEATLALEIRDSFGQSLAFAVVPEPSTFVLLGVGGITLLGYAWRRKRMA